jgi:hypothetical protein
LGFALQPPNAIVGIQFKVGVAIQDSEGNTIPTAGNAVTIALGANSAGGTLSGVTTVGPQDGIATFTLSLDKPGSYTLVATSPDLDGVTSIEFQISKGSNALLFVISNLPNEVNVGQPLTITVTARDPDGSISSDYLGTVHFQSSDPAANLPADYTFTSDDRGLKTFNIVFNSAGDQTLTIKDVVTPTLAGYAGTRVK